MGASWFVKDGDIPGGEIRLINVGHQFPDTQRFQIHWQEKSVETLEFQTYEVTTRSESRRTTQSTGATGRASSHGQVTGGRHGDCGRSSVRSGMQKWPFHPARNVAAITTRQVIEDELPILTVVHYEFDHSWVFVCGTSDATEDGRVISMATALKIDPTLASIADLPPGWSAHRLGLGGELQKKPNADEANNG
jgi:hypothetical protein